VKTLVSRGLDEPRMEVTHVESWQRVRGTQIGLANELRGELDGDADFFAVLASPFNGAAVQQRIA